MEVWDVVARVVVAVLVAYFVFAIAIQVALVVAAGLELRYQMRLKWGERRIRLLASEAIPSITIIAPAYNEAFTIEESVRALLTLQYPKLQIVVVNDGSKDETSEILRKVFQLKPMPPIFRMSVPSAPVLTIYQSTLSSNLVVVDKINGGKADALNAGLNIASGDLVCAVDADTIIENDALLRLIRPFLTRDGVLASGGTIRPVNGSSVRSGRLTRIGAPHNLLAGIQVVEYLRAFMFGRLGWNRLGGNLIVSGAFGLFRRNQVLACGGYLEETVGEDMELVVRLRRLARERHQDDLVPLVPDAVAWTEVPEQLRVLTRQRDRWQRGLADVMVHHRRVLCNPRYGRMGIVVMPTFLLVDLLGPMFEVIMWAMIVMALVTAVLDPDFLILMLFVWYACSIPLSLSAVVMDQLAFRTYQSWGDRGRLVMWSLAENLGYRQIMTAVRIRAMVRYLFGVRSWGEMVRKGFQTGQE